MSRANVEVVKEVLAAFRDRDFDRAAQYLHPQVEARPALVGAPEAVVYQGLEGMKRFWTEIDVAWAEFRIEPSEFRDHGERVLVLGHAYARGRESDLALTAPAAWLAAIRDGKVYLWQSFSSQQEGLDAAGLGE